MSGTARTLCRSRGAINDESDREEAHDCQRYFRIGSIAWIRAEFAVAAIVLAITVAMASSIQAGPAIILASIRFRLVSPAKCGEEHRRRCLGE